MKKITILMLLLIFVFTSFLGAGAAEIEISLLTRMAGTTTQVEIFKDILAEFQEKYPEVEIKDLSQGEESSFNNILKTNIASGTVPNILRIQGVANLGSYIENDVIMNVDQVLEDNPEWSQGFAEGAVKYYQVPGYEGTYGIPMESGLIGVFYNEALLEEAGVEEFPATWSDLKVAIEKLNEIGITPIALGGKTNYMVGHLHNQIFYKWIGVDSAKALGARKMKWTDPKVVETLAYLKELHEMDAFSPGVAGISDDLVTNDFLNGKAAMIITGPWNISRFSDPEETEFVDDIKLAKFPYFEEKPEYKDHDMQVISPYMLSGKLEGKEKELTIELVKMLTSAEAATRFAEEAQFIVPRSDTDIDPDKVSRLFKTELELSGSSTGIAVDVFDYDPLASMQDRTRNSLVSLFIGNSPEKAAAEIQAEIDEKTE